MRQLWAPWRGEYVGKEQPPGCILCEKPRALDDATNYIVARGQFVFALLNLYPYNNGHVMLAPYRHVGEMEELVPEEWTEFSLFLPRLIRALKLSHRPHGFNIGLNLGRVAGAGIPGHLHWHVVPRWEGDTNFMPVVGETRVLPESLETTLAKLRAAWEQTAAT
ncbi:MAG: HIT domain-containing protein [Clostridia bacterium]|nr:HIT domain-containing protein [Clostridia bacterium]